MHRVNPPAPRPCQHHFSSKRACLGHSEWSEHTKLQRLLLPSECREASWCGMQDGIADESGSNPQVCHDHSLGSSQYRHPRSIPRAFRCCLGRIPQCYGTFCTHGPWGSTKAAELEASKPHLWPQLIAETTTARASSKQYVKWIASKTGQLTTNMPGHHT